MILWCVIYFQVGHSLLFFSIRAVAGGISDVDVDRRSLSVQSLHRLCNASFWCSLLSLSTGRMGFVLSLHSEHSLPPPQQLSLSWLAKDSSSFFLFSRDWEIKYNLDRRGQLAWRISLFVEAIRYPVLSIPLFLSSTYPKKETKKNHITYFETLGNRAW